MGYTMLFGQTVAWADLGVIGLLIVLEGVLSIDNALVLGLLAKRLPKSQQQRALTYGLVGAFVFRVAAIATASLLLEWRIVKLFGGGYLAFIAIKALWFERHEEHHEHVEAGADGVPVLVGDDAPLTSEQESAEIDQRVPLPHEVIAAAVPPRGARFWPTVLVIELTDIAFAVDSILAAIALVGAPPPGHPEDAVHPKLWVVIAGGMLGVILMRFAAVLFIKLLERFPGFQNAAYWLVLVIGGKLLADWAVNSPEHPHRLDFHDLGHPAFWVFWLAMVVSFAIGFLPPRNKSVVAP